MDFVSFDGRVSDCRPNLASHHCPQQQQQPVALNACSTPSVVGTSLDCPVGAIPASLTGPGQQLQFYCCCHCQQLQHHHHQQQQQLPSPSYCFRLPPLNTGYNHYVTTYMKDFGSTSGSASYDQQRACSVVGPHRNSFPAVTSPPTSDTQHGSNSYFRLPPIVGPCRMTSSLMTCSDVMNEVRQWTQQQQQKQQCPSVQAGPSVIHATALSNQLAPHQLPPLLDRRSRRPTRTGSTSSKSTRFGGRDGDDEANTRRPAAGVRRPAYRPAGVCSSTTRPDADVDLCRVNSR